ncbi:MAG: 30S ribosomal protein S20 [Patescibacteria group bacterium]
MPIKQNAKKALKQSLRRKEKNLAAKVEIKKMIKDARKMIDAKEIQKAEEAMKAIIQKLDKIAKSGYFKKNKSARLKSRLMTKLNTTKKSS